MKNLISQLINTEQWPIINSITFNDGRMILLDFNDIEKKVRPICDSSLESFMFYNPDDLCSLTVTSIFEQDKLVAHMGEGSYGGDGFVYLLDKKSNDILWVLFLDNSNPFIKGEFEGDYILAMNNLNAQWYIKIDDPLNIIIKV